MAQTRPFGIRVTGSPVSNSLYWYSFESHMKNALNERGWDISSVTEITGWQSGYTFEIWGEVWWDVSDDVIRANVRRDLASLLTVSGVDLLSSSYVVPGGQAAAGNNTGGPAQPPAGGGFQYPPINYILPDSGSAAAAAADKLKLPTFDSTTILIGAAALVMVVLLKK